MLSGDVFYTIKQKLISFAIMTRTWRFQYEAFKSRNVCSSFKEGTQSGYNILHLLK